MDTKHRVLSLFLLVGLVLGLSVSAFAAPQQERRVALIIGNGAYKVGPLKNPANDARDMAATLKSLGFEVILRENAGLRQMNEAIDQFWGSLKKGGVGLFFFAGHGLQVAGENFLVPVDARIALEKDVQYECVNAGKVLGRMEDAGNGLNIVILDACRNNPFARSFRSDSRGLAKMDAPTGSLVAFATAPGDVAADGESKNGLYTSHLLRHLRTPGLKIEDVLKQVRIGVAGDSARMGKKQTPWESSSLMGDFYFAGAGGKAPAVFAAQPVPPGPEPAQGAVASLPSGPRNDAGNAAFAKFYEQPQGTAQARSWLGIKMTDVTADTAKTLGLSRTGGALVQEVLPGSPADSAGLKAGDVLLTLEDQPLDAPKTLQLRVVSSSPGTMLRQGFWRQGQMREVAATLARPPATPQPAPQAQSAQAMPEALAGFFGQGAPAQRFNGALEGTRWGSVRESISDGSTSSFEFLPGGVLRYVDTGHTFENAVWRQTGDSVTISINNGYCQYTGKIVGTGMSGSAQNPLAKWTWSARLAQ